MCLQDLMKFAQGLFKILRKYAQELQREITLIELAPSPYSFIINICVVCMNVFARFDAIPSMTLQDVKEICTYKSH